MFNYHYVLDAKIGKLTAMMDKLSTQNTRQTKIFKYRIYQGKKTDQVRSNHYDKGRQKNRNRPYSRDGLDRSACRRKSQFGQHLGVETSETSDVTIGFINVGIESDIFSVISEEIREIVGAMVKSSRERIKCYKCR